MKKINVVKKILVFTLIGIAFFGCNSNNDDVLNDSDYAEYMIENSIDTEINFMAEEIYTANETQEPALKLKLITSKIFPCINYKLTTTEFINGNELIVRFEQIIEPILCLTVLGPATSYIELPENINKITFLISQKSFNQGYESVIYMSDFLLKNITPKKYIYSPIEIITKENLEFVNYKKEYKEFYYANTK